MKNVVALVALITSANLGACNRHDATAPADGGDAAVAALDPLRIERVTDRRSAKELVERGADGATVETRRRVARGLARIADDASAAALARYLSDEDDEVVAWAAYGLGFSCKVHAEAHVRALVARASTWAQAEVEPARPGRSVSVAFALTRAIGRCATPAGEKTLVAWLKARGRLAEPAAYALGDVTKRGPLADESVTALLDAAAPAHGQPPLPHALFAFARMASVPEPFRPRMAEVARAALTTPGEARIFAVRALARAGVAEDALRDVAVDRSASIAERAEAARGLGQAGLRGRRAAGDALVKLTQSGGLAAAIMTPEVHVLGALVDAARDDKREARMPASLEKSLYALAGVPVPADRTSPQARRAEDIRCRAAAALARGDFASDVLRACAPEGSEPRERAVLRAVLAGSLTGARQTQFAKLARSNHVRVREAALEGAANHPELGPALRPLVAEALASKKPGLVATAAEQLTAHPTRFFGESQRGLAPEVAVSLSAALAEPWAEDLIETKAALVDAAVAVSHPKAKEIAKATCSDSNVTLRQRGLKAMSALGEDHAPCAARPIEVAKEHDALATKTTRIVLDVAGKSLTVALDPVLAPVTTTRLASLARAGFFRGIVVHRVVPGFVVQLGDPGGDGYGGSGKSLRCETSPVPFEALDVGMALAGRDTGSSQFFVTLSRTPHLDGDYTWVGRAEGDWANVVEGETVDGVRVVD